MHVIAQQLGIVVEHLLKVRHHPALIHAVAMKPSGKLVVNAAARHLFERRTQNASPAMLVVAVHGHLQQQVERRRMGKLGLRAEPAVARIELRDNRFGNLVHEGQVQRASAAGKALVVLNGGHHAARCFQRLVAALAPHLRHRQQNAPHSRAARNGRRGECTCRQSKAGRRASETRSAASRPAR